MSPFSTMISLDLRESWRVAVAAWISIASLAIGWFLFGLTVQGADLFLEPTTGFWEFLGFWVTFLLFVLLFWVGPLYICTKVILAETGRRGPPGVRFTCSTIDFAPRLLAVSALLVLLFGQYRAFAGVLDSAIGLTYYESLFGLTYEDRMGILIAEIAPKVLFPALALFGLALGVTLNGNRRAALRLCATGLLLTCIALFPLAFIAWSTDQPIFFLIWQKIAGGGDYSPCPQAILALPTCALIPITWQQLQRVGQKEEELWRYFRLLLVGSLCLITLFVLLEPNVIGRYIVRVQLVPIVLGAWIAPLTVLRIQGIRRRVPAVFITVAIVATLPLTLGDGHDLRLGVEGSSAPYSRPTLEQSLNRWAVANDCEIGAAAIEQRCPPPIIVAAAGGASRSAFYVGAVLGELLDLTEDTPTPSHRFSNRLFAVSGVSGGATGLAFYRAALAEASLRRQGKDPLTPPCDSSRLGKDPLYFASSTFDDDSKIAAREAREVEDKDAYAAAVEPGRWIKTWRGCLEALAAGDFLSPVILSMVFRDILQLNFVFEDRAVALERGWENRFRDLTGADWMANDFLELRKQTQRAEKDIWIPLAIFASTSESNGRRILFTDFIPSDCFIMEQKDFTSSYMTSDEFSGRRTCINTFSDADDIYTLFEDVDFPDTDEYFARYYASRPCENCAIPLSVAASASARFPIISPHANIRNANGAIYDRIVDGGYFENFGAIAALELAEAITRIARRLGDETLVPMVFIVKNEPNLEGAACSSTGSFGAGNTIVWPTAEPVALASAVTTPINTFLASRSARGRHASQRLCKRLAEIWKRAAPDPGEGTLKKHIFDLWRLGNFFAEFDVDLANRPRDGISMNWWLSKHVQEALDGIIRRRDFRRGSPVETVLNVLDSKRSAAFVEDEEAFPD